MLETRRSTPGGTPWDVVSQAETPLNVPIDSNGNLIQKTENSSFLTYEWNAENQLVRVTKDAVEVATFKYDPLGRRIEKAAGGVTTSYTYDEEDILRETNGGTTYTYVHGEGIDEPMARESGGSVACYHADGLGSIVKMTDSAGTVVQTRHFDSWGNLTVGADQSGYAFTGREWDPETGLYYYRARYYGAGVGRFLSEDPIPYGPNFYTYVGSAPLNASDPFGLQAVPNNIPPVPLPPAPPPAEVIQFPPRACPITGPGLVWRVFGVIGLLLMQHGDGFPPEDCEPFNMHTLHDPCRAKPQAGCQPCDPPVGSLRYRLDTTHTHYPWMGRSHWHIDQMHQSPSTAPLPCNCFWKEIANGQGPTPPGIPSK